jgi:RES domain-containing protein
MPVVYAGSTVALVALEYFVHLSGDEPADLVLLRVQVPEGASVDTIPSARLPESWQAELGLTQRLGREWIESRRTLVLTVPCAIVPEESNALVNPSHPEWNDVETAVMRAFHFDRRMYRS